MAVGDGAGARQQQAVMGLGRAAGPDLLAVDAPLVAFENRLGAQPGQIRARVGFGKALAPELAHGQDIGQKALFLGFRAHGHDDGPGEFLAYGAHAVGHQQAADFLVHDQVFAQA
ncbi:hypothetical protein D3C85_1506320 [compost metagenome]